MTGTRGTEARRSEGFRAVAAGSGGTEPLAQPSADLRPLCQAGSGSPEEGAWAAGSGGDLQGKGRAGGLVGGQEVGAGGSTGSWDSRSSPQVRDALGLHGTEGPEWC